jgi:TadE-like protein
MHTRKNNTLSRLKRQDGQAFVEFVIVLPLLVMLVFGIAQFGVAFHNYLSITDAARVGARVAAVNRTNTPCNSAGVVRTRINDALSSKQQSYVIFPADWCDLPDGPMLGKTVGIKIQYPYEIGLPGLPIFSGNLEAIASERLE